MTIKKLAAAACTGVIMMLVCFVFINIGVLAKAGDKKAGPIDAETAFIVDNTDGSTDIFFNAEDGVYINKLLFDIGSDQQRYADIGVKVTCLDKSLNETEYVYNDKNPVYVGTEVIIINKSNVTAVHIFDNEPAGPGFTAGNFRIDNSLSAGFSAMTYAWMFGFAAASLLLFRKTMVKKPEAVFLITALCMGISMVISLPRTKAGYDEETHMQSVMAIASFPSGELHISDEALYQLIVTEYNNPEAYPANKEEMLELDNALAARCDYKSGSSTPDFHVMLNRAPAYLAMAAGVKAAKFFNLSWPVLIVIMRLSNLFMYIGLMYAAIRIAPYGKHIMMFIGLLPQMLFMASTCSYDPFIAGIMSLGYAFMLKGQKYIAPMLICFILGCLPKAVYAPVVLMGLAAAGGVSGQRTDIKAADAMAEAGGDMAPTIIPDDNASPCRKKTADKRRLIVIAASVLVFAALTAAFILPTAINPGDSGDIRGGAVSEVTQVGFILGHPLKYTIILLRQMLLWTGKCWFGPDCMTFMGHVVNGESAFMGYYPLYMAILAAAVLLSYAVPGNQTPDDDGRSVSLNGFKKAWMLLMVFAASVLIWTAMYVAFTEPGAEKIAGVQGRYFIPLMFPLYMVFCRNVPCAEHVFMGDAGSADGKADNTEKHGYKAGPNAGRDGSKGGFLESKTAVCYYLLMMCMFFLTALTVWTCVASRFGL